MHKFTPEHANGTKQQLNDTALSPSKAICTTWRNKYPFMQKPTLRIAHVGLQKHSQNGETTTICKTYRRKTENLADVGVCVGFVTEKILNYVGVILWYILIVERQPTRKAHTMTNAEIKKVLAEYCEDYPKDIVMAAYSMMGPNELYDGIPNMLEDWADMNADFDW